jgi:hypothetical protein
MKTILTLLILVVAPEALAQPVSPYTRNAVYFEGLGQGLLYSVNFDHRFAESIAVRVGVSRFTIEFISDVSITTIPLMVEYLPGHGSSHLEIGLGLIPVYGSISSKFFRTPEGSAGAWVILATATLGYRYQPVNEGILFRIGLTPLMGGNQAQVWGGASIGWAF